MTSKSSATFLSFTHAGLSIGITKDVSCAGLKGFRVLKSKILNHLKNTFKIMYKLTTRSRKAEKQFYNVLNSREGISEKLEKLKINPRRELDAHKLRGKLEGKWSCSLGYDIRMVYEIDDENKEIVVLAVGSHKIYE